MSLPKAYLTSAKNLPGILDAIKSAKAPDRFTQKFLKSLEYKASADRLIIGLLKSLKFLDDNGAPTKRYYSFLDQTQSGQVLADGIRESYADLFAVNVNAHTFKKDDFINKVKTLSEGSLSDSVMDKMAMTFIALVKLADFSTPAKSKPESTVEEEKTETHEEIQTPHIAAKSVKLGGLVYNIQLILPESRDPAVYDALFRSLKEHLL